MQRIPTLGCIVAVAVVLAACGSDDDEVVFNPYAGYSSARYSDDSLWLCRPGLATDQCEVNDLSATVVNADGSLAVQEHEPAATPAVDCFYVYPTVDLSSEPGNHTDFSDISLILDPLLSQAAPFTSVCRMFAPLYRQGTLGSFGSPNQEEIFALAYGDVEEAFRHYMGQYNEGRRFIIMGHSQGTGMVTQLLQNEIDGVPQLRERLVAALLIGGSVTVPEGQRVGGTFANIPLCSTVEETGCAIAFRTYAAGFPPTGGSNEQGPEGMDTACTNPAALGGGKATLRSAYFPLMLNQAAFDVRDPSLPEPNFSTGFVAYPSFYTAECVKDDRNRSYLEIGFPATPGDIRPNPILLTHPVLTPSFLGTHILDYAFTLGNLLQLAEAKAGSS